MEGLPCVLESALSSLRSKIDAVVDVSGPLLSLLYDRRLDWTVLQPNGIYENG
jgi:hypothetical protein